MKLVGILYNPRPERALPLAGVIAMWLKQQGLEAEIATTYQASVSPFLQNADLLVTLGGDGSILRVARAAAPYSTPILGINLGRVGFLTEAEPDVWKDVLSRALADDYWIEERMMLRVVALRNGEGLAQATALNDVVVGRGQQRAVHDQETRPKGKARKTDPEEGSPHDGFPAVHITECRQQKEEVQIDLEECRTGIDHVETGQGQEP